MLWQASALIGLCRETGTTVKSTSPTFPSKIGFFRTSFLPSLRYIKPHGALYHAVLSGGPQSRAVVEAAGLLGLPLLLMPGFAVPADITEGFAERAYDGHRLRDRKLVRQSLNSIVTVLRSRAPLSPLSPHRWSHTLPLSSHISRARLSTTLSKPRLRCDSLFLLIYKPSCSDYCSCRLCV